MCRQKPFRKYNMRKGKGGKNTYSQTRQRFTQSASLHAEAMLIEAQRISHVGCWVWDLTTDRIQFSEEMYRLVGMFPEEAEITPEAFAKFLSPDEAEKILQIFKH